MTSPRLPLLLACSPRRGGNSDSALKLVCETIFGPEASAPPVTSLREHPVLPCVSCGHCQRHEGECPLFARDTSRALFETLEAAPALILSVPIYFYHIPAQLKALVDRSQTAWMLRYVWKRPRPPRRNAHAILMGARQQGDKLFEGSILTLKYWLELFGYDLAPPLVLYGLEGPDDLRNSPVAREAVVRYAQGVRAEFLPPEP